MKLLRVNLRCVHKPHNGHPSKRDYSLDFFLFLYLIKRKCSSFIKRQPLVHTERVELVLINEHFVLSLIYGFFIFIKFIVGVNMTYSCSRNVLRFKSVFLILVKNPIKLHSFLCTRSTSTDIFYNSRKELITNTFCVVPLVNENRKGL